MSLVIDSHQHFWDRSLAGFDHRWQDTPEHQAICRNYLPADLKPQLDAAGVDKTVFVQTQHHLEENRWVLGLADQYDWIAGVVGWVDLAGPACETQLAEFIAHPKFVGVRHVVQDEPDENFIVRDDVSRGLAVLEKHDVAFDLLFYVQHLKHAATVARRFPNLRLVIDHLAKPKIKAGEMSGWQEDLAAAAECPNVMCKLSGMITEADWQNWKPADLKPYVETAVELFGPSRCMFGSDWPVCELAGSYQDVVAALRECLVGLSEDEQAQIMGGTAESFYRI